MKKQPPSPDVVERNKRLIEKHPYLYPDWLDEDEYDYSFTELDMMPEGWRIAFGEQLCEDLTESLRASGELDDYGILQIKEKYGALHWYDDGADENTYKLLNGYELLSRYTCIKCGKPATKISLGWISPYCDECADGMREKFKSIEEYYGVAKGE